jgi:hypothetical protein
MGTTRIIDQYLFYCKTHPQKKKKIDSIRNPEITKIFVDGLS